MRSQLTPARTLERAHAAIATFRSLISSPPGAPKTGFSTLLIVAIYLCHEQPDLYVHAATVLDSRPGAVVLSQSAFHPGGGGQVSDIGEIEWSGGRVAVTGIEIDGD